MKFGANLQAHLTPEWRSQYIDYEVLKSMLYECKEEAPSEECGPTQETERHIALFEEQFFAECDVQLTKVNTFFAEKQAESTRKFAILQSELQAHKNSMSFHRSITDATSSTSKLRKRLPRGLLRDKEKVRIKTTTGLKLGFSEYYLSLVLLQNYQELNFTGFRKILKKHDKMLDTDKGANWRKNYVETAPFHNDNVISEYILKTENLYINELENGDRAKAMKRLRVPPLTDNTVYPKGAVFRVGLFLGMFIVLIAVVGISNCRNDNIAKTLISCLLFRLYRAGFITFLFLACLGFNIWGWRIAGVNHISALFGIVWALSLISFQFGHLSSVRQILPVYLNPSLVYLAYLAFLLNPLPILFHKARFWLLKRLWRLFACGFYRVEFADFWLADQLNSLAVLFMDAEFLCCFYAYDGDIWSGPWFSPYVTGELQSVYFFLWLASLFIGSCYTFGWDIKMDWGFLDRNAGENKFLREEIVYPYKALYYFAIFEDLVIRFSWIIRIALTQSFPSGVMNLAVGTTYTVLEVLRRFVWNFFRLENEHLNNCGEFRAVRDISIAPLRVDDLAALERMMDDIHGV
uniref:SPX domain-containing protein n=1 Tax=Ciona savignyi TaxID=51511 RepID=H2YB42_CIOSA